VKAADITDARFLEAVAPAFERIAEVWRPIRDAMVRDFAAAADRWQAEVERERRQQMTDHSGHHGHRRGARTFCCCGEPRGMVTTDDLPSDADVCEVCHERGVVATGVRSAFRIPEPEPYRSWRPMSAEEAEEAARAETDRELFW
jgi:hypothetical protein